jgi:hypothetical protein
MTVKELIEALQMVDPDRVVVVSDDDNYFEVVRVDDGFRYSPSERDIFNEPTDSPGVPCAVLWVQDAY